MGGLFAHALMMIMMSVEIYYLRQELYTFLVLQQQGHFFNCHSAVIMFVSKVFSRYPHLPE